MSEKKTVRGKLIEIDVPQIITNASNRVCYIAGKMGIKINSYDMDYPDEFIENNVYLIDGKTYIIIDKEDIGSDSFYEADLNIDGSIDFFVSYHNGGEPLQEAIETAIKDLQMESK